MTPEEKAPETPAQESSNLNEGADEALGAGETRIDADGAQHAVGDASHAAPGVDPAIDPRVDDILGDPEQDNADCNNSESPESQSASADSDNPGEDLQAKLAAAEARADENWDRLLRMQADVENKNKRAQRDVQNARKFALEGVANDLLPIKDSLEMGLAAAQEEAASVESIREGSELTLKMLASAMEKHQICELNPVGEKFNPEFHQAMSMLPAEDGTEPNTVIHVMQKGYTLNERLIRPALVTVAK